MRPRSTRALSALAAAAVIAAIAAPASAQYYNGYPSYGTALGQRPYWSPPANPWGGGPVTPYGGALPPWQQGQGTTQFQAQQQSGAPAAPGAEQTSQSQSAQGQSQGALPTSVAAGAAAPRDAAALQRSTPTVPARPTAPQTGERLAGTAQAIDGSTLSFGGQRVRLLGIEAPTPDASCRVGTVSWRCGERATAELGRILSIGPARCTVVVPGDSPEAVCAVGRDSVAALLVHSGMAVSEDPELRGRMEEAKADRRGLWSGWDFAWRQRR